MFNTPPWTKLPSGTGSTVQPVGCRREAGSSEVALDGRDPKKEERKRGQESKNKSLRPRGTSTSST